MNFMFFFFIFIHIKTEAKICEALDVLNVMRSVSVAGKWRYQCYSNFVLVIKRDLSRQV